MSPTITHVLFDLDGTLLDSEALYTEATQIVCDRYGATFDIELKRKIMGGDSREGAISVIQALACGVYARDAAQYEDRIKAFRLK